MGELAATLEEMYGGESGVNMPPQPKAAYLFPWSSSPLFKGAYSFLPTGALPQGFAPLLAPEGDNLFFAGEAFHARYSGYLHGAYESGEEAAKQIAFFLERTSCVQRGTQVRGGKDGTSHSLLLSMAHACEAIC